MSRKRKEFPRSVRVAAVKRATRIIDGDPNKTAVYCEECALPAKKWEFDHVDPDALDGVNTLENCALLCLSCHAEKTANDVARIAKAKRQQADHLGAPKPGKRSIKSAGFRKADKQRLNPRKSLPPRQMFREERGRA